ncbi:LRR receptor-like serine/threonine-protein kinase RGI2 isoform X3 [Prosopis cineraria]|uniref:LRR receptor-like serine/threonine-protein kinase RGI2 isoform X3 n=1 Tax=Prosopis cineraria TaxID=364024 RepID=UPI00240F643B|nr:LRR receptor-like serine/threonine-protein kinase RGI2 isoform X3 [Prosopis cineraria]
MSSNAITLFIMFLNIPLFPSVYTLNQEGLSLLSWLSTFSSSDSATSFSSWNPTDKSPCKWDYIKCSKDGFVSDIVITSVNLRSSFPKQLLSFGHLTALVISNGNLTGEIPSSVGNLSSLVSLDLSFNALTGTIPAEIGKLPNLQWLKLNSNSLHGEIPTEIGNCSKLRLLELYDNQLSGKIPREIGHLKDLEMFRAGGNQGIHGEIPMQISNCKALTFLGLADTGISGEIPSSIGELKNLKTLSVYTANLTGHIPPEVHNCSALENLFLYENQLSGNIPYELGFMKSLRRVMLWQNNLTGTVPESLGNCTSLMVVDFSLNSLEGELPVTLRNLLLLEGLLLSDNNISGEIPSFIGNFSRLKQLELDNNRFSGEIPPVMGQLKELTLFFAWQNQLYGSIPTELSNCQLPPDIGSCTNLVRLRLGSNSLSGSIPPEIGLLSRLSFLELSDNLLNGEIPGQIGNCNQLEMLDLHRNQLQGTIPSSFEFLVVLNVLDLSTNRISGSIPQNLGKLTSLNKLIISGNGITGLIPQSMGLCTNLQLLDISNNRISGSIPDEIGQLQGLDILLNLSWNSLTGPIPESFSNLSKLSNLDLSHNKLTGSLRILGSLDNLVSLNVSYNSFYGSLPDTKFFHDLPAAAFVGNPELCINNCEMNRNHQSIKSVRNVIIYTFLGVILTAMFVTFGVIFALRIHGATFERRFDEESEMEWTFTPFQKLNFSINDIVTKLSDSNVVGKGCSGIVYRVETPMKQIIAVKKLWPVKNDEPPERDLFSAEVQTLGSIRHKNIVRLLGCCNNGRTRLLLFDYISNGSLCGLLHEKRLFLDWDARYKIILGAAQGLEYLHHDCIPPIVHRDIKANNILVGPQFEAFIADFGLAKLVNSSECSKASAIVAGSYGYIAPEYGYSLRITEKSDVYSYGVVLLEVLTGMEPTDNRIPEGAHIVSWVSREIREKKREFTSILDQQLVLQCGTRTPEMLQVLGVALLCVNPSPEERPTMKDVTAMLKEIRHETDIFEKPSFLQKGEVTNPKVAVHCSSFSRSCEPLIESSSSSSSS